MCVWVYVRLSIEDLSLEDYKIAVCIKKFIYKYKNYLLYIYKNDLFYIYKYKNDLFYIYKYKNYLFYIYKNAVCRGVCVVVA